MPARPLRGALSGVLQKQPGKESTAQPDGLLSPIARIIAQSDSVDAEDRSQDIRSWLPNGDNSVRCALAELGDKGAAVFRHGLPHERGIGGPSRQGYPWQSASRGERAVDPLHGLPLRSKSVLHEIARQTVGDVTPVE
jgi:hypothetical protein